MRAYILLLLLAWSARAACIPPPNTWDWEAHKWRTNIVNNSGTISGSSYMVGVTFMQQVKRWDVRRFLGRVNLYLGNQTNAMLCSIIFDWRSDIPVDTLEAFVAGDYTEATGLTGNTTTKYLNCAAGGLAMDSFTVGTNLHLAAYVRTGSDEASDVSGVLQGSSTYALAISNAGQTYLFMGTVVANVADASGVGFYCSTRTSSTNGVTYKNGVSLVSSTTADTGGIPTLSYTAHALNFQGTSVIANTSRALSYYAVGFGLQPDKLVPYNLAVQIVQRSVGRAVP